MNQSIRVTRVELFNPETNERFFLIPFNAYWKGLRENKEDENFRDFNNALKHYFSEGFVIWDIKGLLKIIK